MQDPDPQPGSITSTNYMPYYYTTFSAIYIVQMFITYPKPGDLKISLDQCTLVRNMMRLADSKADAIWVLGSLCFNYHNFR